jgi:hypothetical protein
MIHTLRCTALGAGLAVVTALAGCSSSGGGDGSSSSGGPTSSAGGDTANAATTKAIKHAYTVFFNSRETTAHAVASLQHGSKFRSSIISEGKSNYGKQKTVATVSSVKLIRPKLADVAFTVKVAGHTVLPDSHGFAVREGGKWRVAAKTYCSLLTLEGTAPPVCKNKSITALPG